MEDINSVYRKMADEELLALALEQDDLTDAARDALQAELRGRNLSEEASRIQQKHSSETATRMERSLRLVEIATFNHPLNANFARSRLESEGIEVFMDSRQGLGQVFGGGSMMNPSVMQVKEEDAERAGEILGEIEGDFEGMG